MHTVAQRAERISQARILHSTLTGTRALLLAVILYELFMGAVCWRMNSQARMYAEEVVESRCASSVSLRSDL